MPLALHLAALASLLVAAVCAGLIAYDVARRPQHMWIMNVAWPVCALFGGVLVLLAYVRVGRAPEPSRSGQGHEGSHDHGVSSMAVSVGKGALHCGSGCTLGDIIAEWIAVLIPAVAVAFGWHWLFAEKIFAVWVLDFLLAFGFGVAFQYFAIKPMRDITVREGILQALKADTASLIAWQLGMYGAMALAHFWLFPEMIGTELKVASVEFWFTMQIAMICGFVTAYPVNWWLIRAGVKEEM
ncbi:DUF4396 domain-containing protein [Alloyangia pacifica]|uniref:DUF4396 domain-containing protein n=1 Tax=Alloyangia pacifica TaxID=311180 RepID=UPI001FDF721C|nr:DUF4396 domain-containing protein [Alloyangia pacifica]